MAYNRMSNQIDIGSQLSHRLFEWGILKTKLSPRGEDPIEKGGPTTLVLHEDIMKKPMLFFVTILCATSSILAQIPTIPAPQTVPTAGYPGYTNQPNVGGLTFSNRAGQTYSPEDLANQLQNLRTAIDQALPVLAAFNEHYSN